MYFEGKTIVISGASAGIGQALALAFAAHKATLVLGARRLPLLHETAELCKAAGATNVHVHPLDVGSETSVDTFSAFVQQHCPEVHVLVNNAGISQRALAADTDFEVVKQLMQVNFLGQVQLTQKMLPALRKTNGHIAVISSLSGLFGWPQRSAYAASKHALHGYFETLQVEEPLVATTLICPGRVNTGISLNALKADGTPHNQMDKAQLRGIAAGRCASIILKAVQNRRRLRVIAGSERVMLWLYRYIRPLFFMLARRLKANG